MPKNRVQVKMRRQGGGGGGNPLSGLANMMGGGPGGGPGGIMGDITPEMLAALAPRDKNTVHCWPAPPQPAAGGEAGAGTGAATGEAGTVQVQQEYQRYRVVWPVAIDVGKTMKQGRVVAKEYCVEDPDVREMAEVCRTLGLPHAIEPYRRYPRDFMYTGRLRVKLTNADGSPVNPQISNRRALLIKMGEMIPGTEARARIRAEKEEAAKKAAEEAKTQGGTGGGATGGASHSGSRKKSNKKRGKKR